VKRENLLSVKTVINVKTVGENMKTGKPVSENMKTGVSLQSATLQ